MEFKPADVALFKQYLSDNRADFEGKLLDKAANVRDKIDEIRLIGNIHLLHNAYKLVNLVVEDKKQEVFYFAQEEGVAWASSKLTLELKLEWVQAIRRTLWIFLQEFDEARKVSSTPEQVYAMEEKVNELIDQFLHGFFTSYSTYKDHLIESQQKLVDHLSVPIIPIAETVSVLPLIGEIDVMRAKVLEEKILLEIGKHRIALLFIDLSGIAEVAADSLHYLVNILSGIEMMGCRPVITGLQPKIVQALVREGDGTRLQADTKASLQQALRDYLIIGEKA